MLYTQKLLAELERQRASLATYRESSAATLAAYRAALEALGDRFTSAAALTAAQHNHAANDDAMPNGAHATAEYDTWRRTGPPGMPRLPFGRGFAHHADARGWAECVRGTTTLAVDGSQLMPWRDASVPVALVQAGIFENPHLPPTPYLKDVVTELLVPDELASVGDDTVDLRSGETLSYSEQIVHLRRFELEVRTLIARMQRYASGPASRNASATPVVAFYDGSLIVSFALKMSPPTRERYVAAARRLLAASHVCRVPLVGYIDTSYAHDIVRMLRGLAGTPALPEPYHVHDALLWSGVLAWGDRTPAFVSARDDLPQLGYTEAQDAVAFVYFQAALDRAPARLELPLWVVQDGLLDGVMDVVRAETIAGSGYPYAIETADALAVISTLDRAHFYELFQRFAEQADLGLSVSRKALSKSRRRVR